jgi:hypothetical protein
VRQACLVLAALTLASAADFRVARAVLAQVEDGPPAPPSLEFFPGERIYFSLQVAGFQTEDKEEEKRFARMRWTVSVLDSAGIALVAEKAGQVQAEVLPEDREWMPKIRHEWTVPEHAPGGDYRVVARIWDEIGKTDVRRELPFRVGGPLLEKAAAFSVRHFYFYRSEESRAPLDPAVYRAGEPVFARFELAGFQLGAKNELDVEYQVTVKKPDGEVSFRQEQPAREKFQSFYPKRVVPAALQFTFSREVDKGEYTIVVDAQDHVGKRSQQATFRFTIE